MSPLALRPLSDLREDLAQIDQLRASIDAHLDSIQYHDPELIEGSQDPDVGETFHSATAQNEGDAAWMVLRGLSDQALTPMRTPICRQAPVQKPRQVRH